MTAVPPPAAFAVPGSFRWLGRAAACPPPDRAAAPAGWLAVDAPAPGDGFAFDCPAGTFSAGGWLTADFLALGDDAFLWRLLLAESAGACDAGRYFSLQFAGLPWVEARLRLSLAATDQNRWALPREGALLKPLCGGVVVDPARVGHVRLTIERAGDAPSRWAMGPFAFSAAEPPRLAAPRAPRGAVLDGLGQAAGRDWPGKTRSAADLADRLRRRAADAFADDNRSKWPAAFSAWGGWKARRLDATGRFRVEHDGTRWWLVDPDGHPFWSAGPDCVRRTIEGVTDGLPAAVSGVPAGDAAPAPDSDGFRLPHVNALGRNFARAFGPDWGAAWERLALAELRALGANTIGNWSEADVARRGRFPYVMPLPGLAPRRAGTVFRDFPDVFAPGFADDAADFARAGLAAVADDPALVGYFLMNEPTWGFSPQTPAEGMLFVDGPADNATRAEFARWLAARHGDDAGLARAWGAAEGPGGRETLAAVRAGRRTRPLPPGARADCEAFSARMAAKLFDTLSAACRAVDPGRLNLGARYYTIPPDWALAGMTAFDVFSVNCYRPAPPPDFARITEKTGRPVLLGEWHFGALDAGCPASGIGRVRDQAARGAAYRAYLETAAAYPWCVGAHWFTFYDQSALGRFDGECYNIGWFDVCHRPYAMTDAVRAAHEAMYEVAAGRRAPFAAAPEYLPMVFF